MQHTYRSKNLDHLGIVSQICDEIGIVETYDNHEGIGLVTFGYHRPDLKQFMIYLMSSQDGDVPLLAKTVAGNTSDKELFRERLKELQGQIQSGDHM